MVPQKPAARLLGVGKRFGGVWACQGIDLVFNAGEIHALMGENGAGKSTLVKMLHGEHQPDEGQVEIAGASVALTSPRLAEARGVAMVPQELDLFPNLTVLENLFVGRRRPRTQFGLFDGSAMRAAARNAFAPLGMEIDLDLPVARLSGADAQMVVIARALMRDATVLILDEPTAALTDREQQRLLSVLRDLAARGTAVIYISHRLEEIFQVADQVSVLRDGALIGGGRIGDFDTGSLVQMMIGRPLDSLFERQRRPPGSPLLQAEDLGRRGVFSGIDLTLHQGEIVGLAGLIGSGRTEVAHCLCGLERPTSGRVLLNGEAIAPGSIAAGMNLGIGYVPEERRSQGLLIDFPIAWNIALPSLDRLSRAGWVNRSAEGSLASKFGSAFAIKAPSLEAPVVSLSGGNQQKVLLAKVLAAEPEVILLDEPTRGVDVGAKAEIYRIVDGLAAEGKAVLMISSDMNELLSIADRIVVMHQGRCTGVFDGPDFDLAGIGGAVAGVSSERAEDSTLHPGAVQ